MEYFAAVSFGYSIDKMEERESDFVATNWRGYEISLVSLAADPTVGSWTFS